MTNTLNDIKTAWEKRDARGQRSSSGKAKLEDDENVFKMADAYVKAHKDDFAGFENLSVDVLVKLIEEARDKGDEDAAWKYQVWEWHAFERQTIGGEYHPQLRIANG